jgi:hypothetical protein
VCADLNIARVCLRVFGGKNLILCVLYSAIAFL